MFQFRDGGLVVGEPATIWFAAAALWTNIIADFADGGLDNRSGLVIVITPAKG